MSSMFGPDDPDFLYLGVDKKKMMAEMGDFDSKKSVWIPDEKDMFIPADIESTTGDVVAVKTRKGEVGLLVSAVEGGRRRLISPSFFSLSCSESRSEKGRHATNESAQVLADRRHGQSDVSQRRQCAGQSATALLQKLDLCKGGGILLE